ncbi:carbon-nitrogen hydrolase family protein [Peptostreptococcus russellii]|uniref:carbon-nitrogen hydrolase family protein n=1 Tax=Peptostreptococcus russellii TaxID=215200 RepID=UPI001627D4D6|nr:carbon-nitrogen hydrolase family protein [uncultured Peptostreptococcus sp.]MBC2577130.1 carbon-nitrogen hydrolase family protein [Peptostreptococcus russellii]
MEKYKLAVVQMKVTDNKKENISKAKDMIREAAQKGANLVILPEIFNSPYNNSSFPVYAEEFPGETSLEMMKIAKECSIVLVAGSIPEKEGDSIFNTCYVYNESGEVIGRHRKIHLFDINIKGGQYFKESDVLTAGKDFTVVDTKFGKIGIAICYDVRFPEYFRILSEMGAELVALPAAFNMTTGPAHWEISLRMRAVDNQIYMAAASPARDESQSYVSYANSMIVDPWGKVLENADTDEKIIYSDIYRKRVYEIREQLPLLKHLRKDLYKLKYK